MNALRKRMTPAVMASAGSLGAAIAAKAPMVCRIDAAIERVRELASIDRKRSLSGLYTMEKGRLKSVDDLDKATGPLLARTDGLTAGEKRALYDMDVQIRYVREIPGPVGMEGVEASYPRDAQDLPEEARESRRRQRERLDGSEGPVVDDLGLMIVPYLVLNKAQARAILGKAETMPLPKKEVPYRAPFPDDIPVACWWGYPGC